MVTAARPHQSRLVLLVHLPSTAVLLPSTAVLPRQLLGWALRRHPDPSAWQGGFWRRPGHVFRVLTETGGDTPRGEKGS